MHLALDDELPSPYPQGRPIPHVPA
jgi:hypothetical protein